MKTQQDSHFNRAKINYSLSFFIELKQQNGASGKNHKDEFRAEMFFPTTVKCVINRINNSPS